ncbi:MAG TPA: hypothetical protein VFZ65_21275 [Planctomycetota bacterium]|nr:hypothetical protein [Planctomycetota bacterium]
MLALGLVSACDGSLSHRSVAEMSGTVTIEHDVERVRVEVQNGTVGVDSGTGRVIQFAGGVRRAADTASELARIEQIPVTFTAAPDPVDPHVLVLRGPAIPAGGPLGILGVEVGIRMPADIALEIAVAGSGHITVANRTAPTRAETGRGDLRFERCAGGVRARTGRGNVIAVDHIGDLDIQTTVGGMQAFVREPGALIRLVTGQGTVQCHVPAATGFDLDARTEEGRIRNGFGLTAETVREYGAALVAKVGSARTAIVLRTGSGHLSLAPKAFD